MPNQIISAPNPQQAFIDVLESSLTESLLPTVPLTSIVQTGFDRHSPEYDVTISPGKVLHVECDDDGDGAPMQVANVILQKVFKKRIVLNS